MRLILIIVILLVIVGFIAFGFGVARGRHDK